MQRPPLPPPREPRAALPQPVLPGHGLPHERQMRIAARRSFVEMKLHFTDVVAPLGGPRGDWLRFQVRQAQEPMDLWLLRGPVFDALGHSARHARLDLQRALDAMFAASDDTSASLPPLFL